MKLVSFKECMVGDAIYKYQKGVSNIMKQIDWTPKEKGLDHTLGVLKEGYQYIPNRMKAYQTNMFETRVLGQKTICLSGKEAAELFYNNEKFIRINAAPKRVLKTLFGLGGVQTLDGEEHRHRKAMFMSLMKEERLDDLKATTKQALQQALERWEKEPEIELFTESKYLLTRIASKWAGLPLPAEEEMNNHVEAIASLFEKPTSVGRMYFKTVSKREDLEKWVRGVVTQVRDGQIQPREDSALAVMSHHRDLDGNLLDSQIVAVEILNIIRPIVAIAVYLNFTALAVIQQPNEVSKLKTGDEDTKQRFIQEVRRFYPFFPVVLARVRSNFVWEGYTFKRGTLTILDLYGTNHDSKTWTNPDVFDPDRFKNWSGSPFDFIPQGGGDYWEHHRCPGEWVTIEVMKIVLEFLVNDVEFSVPKQDFNYSMGQMPSIPKSLIRLQYVKSKY